MEFMYVKYEKGNRNSIIKDGEVTIIDTKKIIPLANIKNSKCVNAIHTNNKVIIHSNLDYKINEEITNFFFTAIHKNYINNRKNIL